MTLQILTHNVVFTHVTCPIDFNGLITIKIACQRECAGAGPNALPFKSLQSMIWFCSVLPLQPPDLPLPTDCIHSRPDLKICLSRP